MLIILADTSQVEGTHFASRIGKSLYYSMILAVHIEEHYDAIFRSQLSRFSSCILYHLCSGTETLTKKINTEKYFFDLFFGVLTL